MKWTPEKTDFVTKALAENSNSTVITRKKVIEVCEKYGIDRPNWLLNGKQYRAARGSYNMPNLPETTTTETQTASA